MSRVATKASDNIFYLARFKAASFNDRLSSREGAAEELGMDRSRLAKIELDLINPYPEEVKMMAMGYRAPELTNYFCREKCPLGCDIPKAEIEDLDRITVRAVASFRKLESARNVLLDVASDGKVTDTETCRIKEVMDTLHELEGVAQSLRLWMKKTLGEEV